MMEKNDKARVIERLKSLKVSGNESQQVSEIISIIEKSNSDTEKMILDFIKWVSFLNGIKSLFFDDD